MLIFFLLCQILPLPCYHAFTTFASVPENFPPTSPFPAIFHLLVILPRREDWNINYFHMLSTSSQNSAVCEQQTNKRTLTRTLSTFPSQGNDIRVRILHRFHLPINNHSQRSFCTWVLMRKKGRNTFYNATNKHSTSSNDASSKECMCVWHNLTALPGG